MLNSDNNNMPQILYQKVKSEEFKQLVEEECGNNEEALTEKTNVQRMRGMSPDQCESPMNSVKLEDKFTSQPINPQARLD